jgi:soluble lytic murein transglycosylase-like protein
MYDEIIKKWSKIYGIDEKLIRAIIQTESSWKIYAFRREPNFWKRYLVNIKNLFKLTLEKDEIWLSSPDIVSSSYGLMQLMLTTAMELGFRYEYPFELFDPETNIKWGCTLLKKLYNRYGDWKDAIAAYNQGNNRKNIDGTYENQNYVDIVLTCWTEEG